jgi:hypothetical protein
MKMFKLTMIIAIIMTFGFIQKSDAQKQSGLYLTYNDYLNHKLSYTTDPANPNGNKIYIHEFLGRNNVTVISNGKKNEFEKSKIFGYSDNTGNDYRFCDDKAYQIIDTTEFCIYSFDKLIQQGKGPKPTRVYYFSKNAEGEILQLTPENIERVFPKNIKFRYMVEVAYKSDIKLDAYDEVSHEYKIKELYAESLK